MPTKSKEPAVTTEDVAAVIASGVEWVEVEEEPARPAGPKFGICEGTREELERTGKAIDPFTGEVLTRDDLK